MSDFQDSLVFVRSSGIQLVRQGLFVYVLKLHACMYNGMMFKIAKLVWQSEVMLHDDLNLHVLMLKLSCKFLIKSFVLAVSEFCLPVYNHFCIFL